jgi:hypothetical protein
MCVLLIKLRQRQQYVHGCFFDFTYGLSNQQYNNLALLST